MTDSTTSQLAVTISGNVSPEIKEFLSRNPLFQLPPEQKLFGKSIMRRMRLSEVALGNKAEEMHKQEARTVHEIVVDEDMLNGGGNVHGGCSAFLVDVCTSIALMAYSMAVNDDPMFSVSHSMTIAYHSPATKGDKLRIVSTTVSVGGRTMSARCEIWNATHHRLAVSGMHSKMQPSVPKTRL